MHCVCVVKRGLEYYNWFIFFLCALLERNKLYFHFEVRCFGNALGFKMHSLMKI